MNNRRALRLYLETTVWNFLATEKEEKITGSVTKLYREIDLKRYKMYISPLVIVEIERTKEKKRYNMLRNLIKEYKPELLEDVVEVGRLANRYLSAKIIPEKYRADALHIAFASFYEMDVLVSYNLRHIVKLKTRRLAKYINLLEGYKILEIGTPEEVIEYE